MSGWLPKVGSVWQHGDGGHYVVEANQGRVKFDESEWEPAVRYDHCDGTPSQGPYTTNRSRWEARFKFVAPSLRAWRGETNERSEM